MSSTARSACRCGHDLDGHDEATDKYMNEFLTCTVEGCDCDDYERTDTKQPASPKKDGL